MKATIEFSSSITIEGDDVQDIYNKFENCVLFSNRAITHMNAHTTGVIGVFGDNGKNLTSEFLDCSGM